MEKITCVFRRSTEGRLALLFAADLIRLCQEADGVNNVLHIYLETGEADAAQIASESRPVANLLAEQNAHVLAEVAAITGLAPEFIALAGTDTSGIIVDHTMAFERADLDVLSPSREQSLLARGKGPLLVPFGDSLSALPAANIAIALGKKLTLPVVFYHTTWRDESVASPKAEDHMCAEAREVAAVLKSRATTIGVEFSFAVETADDVAEGILQCALRQGARLIIMPRSAKTTIGCYVNQALAKTPVPLLAVAAKPGRQQ
ncbi:MAG: universal stress protein [Cyanobacteria bacterium SZAS LIN-3]|nr:universal stress protein [Cyanobacteria bacterium SZAS LIN-3]MBS2010585.1 universal stress protein [Cyanobacteria bacterium SZAS TMP-1]